MSALLFWMLVGHAVADYPLQGDFLARGKNHRQPIPGFDWWVVLLNHAAIHGGAVALVTGSPLLGLTETALHFAIDHLKCAGLFGYKTDQALHVASKLLWLTLYAGGVR